MARRDVEQQAAAKAEFDQYVRSVASEQPAATTTQPPAPTA
jgi:hypothetical protein